MFLTCDWGLDVQYGFLLAQDGSSFVDNAKCHCFLHTALFGQVGFEEVYTRFPFTVKDFLQGKAVAQREGDS